MSVRLDLQVLDWLRAKGEGHLTRINDILANLMEAERRVGIQTHFLPEGGTENSRVKPWEDVPTGKASPGGAERIAIRAVYGDDSRRPLYVAFIGVRIDSRLGGKAVRPLGQPMLSLSRRLATAPLFARRGES